MEGLLFFFINNVENFNSFESRDLPPIFDGLVPSIPVIIGAFVGLLILYFAVTYFVYIPLKRYFDGRTNYISKNLENSEKIFEDSKKNLIISEGKIFVANKEAKKIISSANEIGEKERQEIISQAREYAKAMSENIEVNLKEDYRKMKQELVENMSDIIIQTSQKIISKKIDLSSEDKLIKEFIKKIDNE